MCRVMFVVFFHSRVLLLKLPLPTRDLNTQDEGTEPGILGAYKKKELDLIASIASCSPPFDGGEESSEVSLTRLELG